MISMNRFSDSSEEHRYHRAINNIFDFVKSESVKEGLSVEESLGVLSIVSGSLEINLAQMRKYQAQEENDYDEDENP